MTASVFQPEYDDWEMIGAASIANPSTTASLDEINSTGIYSWSFTNGEVLGFSPRQLYHSYKEGTVLTPHIHWCPTTSATYTGTWTLDTICWLDSYPNSDLQAVVTLTAAFDSAMTAWQMQSANFNTTLTGTNRKISSIMAAKLTLALSAGTRCHLLGLDSHYQKDRLGSALITSKT
jgi:hypothetical protein